MVKYIFIFIVLFSFKGVDAQYRELGVFGGGAYYIGDLNPYQHFNQTHYSVGGVYRYNMANERIVFRLHAIYGEVSGEDSKSKDPNQINRNLNFHSSIFEIGPMIEINFREFATSSKSRQLYKHFTPYLFIGLTYFKMNPMGNYNGGEVELQPLATEGQETSQNSSKMYKLNQLSIPLGIGYKFNLGKKVVFSLEYGIRKTFTDHLDDVSGKYPDLELLSVEAGNLSAELSDRTINAENYTNANYGVARGNSKNKDWYTFFGAILSFRLDKESSCKRRFGK